MIKKLAHKFHIIGFRRYQTFFERLHDIALGGMNIGRAGLFEEDGELEALRYIARKEGDRGLVAFDVGANIGDYTRALAHQFGSRTKIYSFEPSKATFKTFSENISTDQACAKNVIATNMGLSDKAGSLELFTDADNSGLASVYQRRLDHVGVSMDKKETIALTTIDEFCAKHRVGEIDFLKMDVEGHELSVLQGAKGMLARKAIKYIQFEFGGNNIDSRTFFQDFYYLLKDDFNIYRVVKDGLCPIKEYKETYECFLCTVFFAERK